MRVFLAAIVVLLLSSAATAQVPAQPSGKISEKQQPATCAVSGQVVTAAEGAPLKSSRIALIQQDVGSHPQAFSATTDSGGRFEIRKIAAGRYSFFATHTGYISQQYQSRGLNGGAALTLVPGQEIDGALFRLVRGAVITGRIVDESGEPMAKIAVMALRRVSAEEMGDWGPRTRKEELMPSSAAMTDDRGEYRIFGLKPGEYYVKASESDTAGLSGMVSEDDGMNWITRNSLGTQYAPVFYPGVIQVDQAQPVVLAAGEEVRAEFAMRQVKTVEVAGRVLGADGRAATHAYVQLYILDAANWSDAFGASTGTKGEFIIKGVPPGSYVLDARQQDEDRFQLAHQKLEVGNENIDSVLLAFSQGTTIRGRVVTAGASIPDRVQVTLESQDIDVPNVSSALSKPDGSFQMNGVADGDYALRIYEVEQGCYVRSARLGGEDVLQKGLQVEKGSVSGTLEIVLSSAGAQLEGAVTDHDQPAAGARVWARPEPETPYNRMRLKSTTTDQNGHFIFKTLPPGKYRVVAKLASASSETPASASEPKILTLGEHDHQSMQLTLASPQSE